MAKIIVTKQTSIQTIFETKKERYRMKNFMELNELIQNNLRGGDFESLTNYIANLPNILEEAKGTIKTKIFEGLESNEDIDLNLYKQILHKINEIQSLIPMDSVNINVKLKQKRAPKNDSTEEFGTEVAENNKQKNISDNQINENKVFTLDDKLTNRKPRAVEFNNTYNEVNSWRHMAEVLCRELYNMNNELFASFVRSKEMNGTRANYFSKSGKDMEAPVLIGEGGTGIFVDSAKLVANDFFFLKKALTKYGLSAKDVIVSIDPEFKRKIRTKKNK